MLEGVRRVAPALLRPEGALLTVGVIAFAVWLVVRSLFPPVPTVEVVRLQGEDRYETAAELALAARPDGARAAILARGDDFPDGLAAASLVEPTEGVLLLTQGDALPEPTRAALEELEVSTVYLSGGEAAISRDVEAELARSYQVIRMSGDDRYETAAAVARQLDELGDIGLVEGRRTAFVVTGQDFPDALAAAATAAAGGFPILLTRTDELPEETAQALVDLAIRRVVVVGGPATIGLPVTIQLQEGDYLVEEIQGPDRAATAAAVAEEFVTSTLVLDGDVAVLARGDAFPDALAAASYAGVIGAPLLLAPTPDRPGAATLAYLGRRQQDGEFDRLVVVGGPTAVTATTVEEARRAAVGQVQVLATPSDAP